MLVRESISFIRDQDPKVSLGIGQVHLIKKWLDEMSIINYVINDDMSIDVKGNINLDYKNLTSIPEFIKFNKVGGYFYCDNNQLTSLEGCPKTVERDFFCSSNQLTSLEGCPNIVKGNFYCNNNKLTSLEGCPKTVGGSFFCSNNQKKFTEKEVRKYCKVRGSIYI